MSSCKHLKTTKQNGQTYCCDCYEELVTFCKDETRFFDDASITLTSERKVAKSIRKELDALPLPDNIKDRADRIYANRVGSNTYRSNVRQEVKFACVYTAYKEEGIVKDPVQIAKMLGIKGKGMSRGMFRCSELFTGKESTTTAPVTAVDFVPDMMARNGIDFDESHLEDIKRIYDLSWQKSDLLNRSKPQSIAAALVFFYLCKKDPNLKITKVEVAKNCGTSPMTISKIANDLERVYATLVAEE